MLASLSLLVILQSLDDPAQEERHVSPSGSHVLLVQPHADTERGHTRYRMTRHGEVQWERLHPFALSLAEVTETGLVVGVAYERTEHNIFHGTSLWGLETIVLADAGRVVRRDRSIVDDLEPWERPPEGKSPGVYQLLVDPDRDEYLAFTSLDDGWWIYELAANMPRTRMRPRDSVRDGRNSLLRTELLPGTPFLLQHRVVHEPRGGEGIRNGIFLRDGADRRGAELRIVTRDGRDVWATRLSGEYEGTTFDSALDQRWRENSPLDTGPRSFTFRSRKRAESFRFELREDPGASWGWRVVELESAPARGDVSSDD